MYEKMIIALQMAPRDTDEFKRAVEVAIKLMQAASGAQVNAAAERKLAEKWCVEHEMYGDFHAVDDVMQTRAAARAEGYAFADAQHAASGARLDRDLAAANARIAELETQLSGAVSAQWVLNQLAGMKFSKQGSAFDYIKTCLDKGNHGPHPYDLPFPESDNPETRAACREFLFAIHAALPDLVTRIGELEAQLNGVGMQEFRRLEAECERLREEIVRLTRELPSPRCDIQASGHK